MLRAARREAQRRHPLVPVGGVELDDLCRRPPTTQCRWVPFWATSRYAHVFIEDQGIEDQGQWRLASSQGTPIVGD